MRKIVAPLLVIGSLLAIGSAHADTITLQDGQTIKGTLVSRDANGVVFDIGGQKLTFSADNVKSIAFGDAAAPAEKMAESVQKAAPVKAVEAAAIKENVNAEIPVGTSVLVKTTTPINSKQHKTGHKFTARLEADLVAGGVVVARRGSNVYGELKEAKKSGRLAGKSSVEIAFTQIIIDNQLKPISTTTVKAVAEGTAKDTVGKTARMAAIGGLINGSSGAKDGAKVGVGLSLLTSGRSVNIPAGTLLEFELSAPLKK